MGRRGRRGSHLSWALRPPRLDQPKCGASAVTFEVVGNTIYCLLVSSDILLGAVILNDMGSLRIEMS